MKNKILLLPAFFLLFACQAKPTENASSEDSELKVALGSIDSFSMPDKANYYWNLNKSQFEEDGIESQTDNLIYASQEIQTPCKLVPPETNPTRENYDFSGWYLEPACETRFDFINDKADTSINLFAGWSRVGHEEYVEPPYVEPTDYDDTIAHQIEITGILHRPVSEGLAYLTYGGMKRLANNPGDCRFAVNAIYKQGAKIESALYDEAGHELTITTSLDGVIETQTVSIYQTSEDLAVSNGTYEGKAIAYEEKGAAHENNHIMLAGSSSIEFWTNYESALSPIVAYSHGIGGTTSQQWRDCLVDRLVVPYSPKAVVYYVGVNDIVNNGKDADFTVDMTKQVLEKTHSLLPNTHVFYILINVLPGYYLGYASMIREVRSRMNEYAATLPWLDNIDAGAPLMKKNGSADKAYFRLDNLHMSEYGYILWGEKIKEALMEYLG